MEDAFSHVARHRARSWRFSASGFRRRPKQGGARTETITHPHHEFVISPRYRRLRQQLTVEPKVWLVTGVAGFIGSSLLEELLTLGQTVVGLDNFSTGHVANLDDVLAAQPEAVDRFSLIEGDIRDLDTCRDVCRGVDYVLHHAALGSVPWSMDDPVTTNAVNVDGFLHMLVGAKDAGVKRVVYASSSAVYGDVADVPQVEERTGRPLSPYAASKTTNETYAMAFQQSYGLQSVGLRYFNVFGRRQDPTGPYAAVIPRWVANLLQDLPCRIFGDGETTRDFCYIANTVQANLLAATTLHENATGQVYNVASGRSTTLNELFRMIRDTLAAHNSKIACAEPLYQVFRPGDIRQSCAAIVKARTLLDYEPTHMVAGGLVEALEWYLGQSAATVQAAGAHAV
jgi:UDP-N-acetylglucosamine 4-epimerase